ncbi:MAG: hypothetical protein JNK88_08070 [Mangrovicoccus sp.]|nr:hypothetical protein [Mangrovicoccus sp.]
MRLTVTIAAVLVAGTLAGCVETTSSTTLATFPPTDQDRTTPAYQACLARIARDTGRSTSDVQIFSYDYSEAGTRILATVAGAEAPWQCLSSNSGVVQEVMYTGSEGAL